MGAAAQAAVQEDAHDQERQQEELQEWERQRAKETWKAGGAQRSLLSLKPNQVGLQSQSTTSLIHIHGSFKNSPSKREANILFGAPAPSPHTEAVAWGLFLRRSPSCAEIDAFCAQQSSFAWMLCGQVLWSYVGRPHGWGAGANKGLGDTPLPRDPLTNNAWRLTNKGSFHVPISSFNVRPPSSTSSVSDQSQVGSAAAGGDYRRELW
eukprot:925245-Pelagomonas_calceolata.AAC.17